MKSGIFCLTVGIGVFLFASVVASPFDSSEWMVPKNEVDRRIDLELAASGIERALPSSDAAFVRRIYLDLCGTLPERAAVRAFLADPSRDKRSRLIDALIGSDDYVEFFTLRWCDLLRVKSEYPVNLWPNAVQAYHRWVKEAVVENRPYDRFAEALLTATGSNFRLPASNFYRVAPSKGVRDLAEVVSFTFMGLPLDALGEERTESLMGFFYLLRFKKTQEWKEEIVYWSGSLSKDAAYRLPGGEAFALPEREDPRPALAAWMVGESNPLFARCAVNRIWYWLNGYGLFADVDDISSDCLSLELVDYLSQELVSSGYDLQRIMRLILSSRTYQQSCIPREEREQSPFAAYQLRPLEAEVLADALSSLLGIQFNYTSPIPEPFTFIPKDTRTIALADGSITSPFLETFGRPSRDSGRLKERSSESTASQRLYLLNSEDMHSHLTGRRLLELVGDTAKRPAEWVEGIYLCILSREPSRAELRSFMAIVKEQKGKGRRAYIDLAWALINSKEFQFKH